MTQTKHVVALALSAALLAGCDKEATGQVAAVVNGDEITLQEINAELGSANVPEGADKKAVQQAVLQRVLERRLLAQAAVEDGIDKSPEYLVRERLLKDSLLVQLMSQRTERTLKVPEQAAIDKFIAENPSAFAERRMFAIDRIQFPVPADLTKLKVLEADHSMDAVAARLRTLGIQFRRDKAQMDSAQLGQQRIQALRALPPGEPFVIPENGVVTVGVITGEQAVTIPAEQQQPMALQAMRNKALGEALANRLKQARSTGKIEYQTGFAPPAPPKPGAAAAPAAAASAAAPK